MYCAVCLAVVKQQYKVRFLFLSRQIITRSHVGFDNQHIVFWSCLWLTTDWKLIDLQCFPQTLFFSHATACRTPLSAMPPYAALSFKPYRRVPPTSTKTLGDNQKSLSLRVL